MLKIALPNKGSLSEDSLKLLREAGYKLRRDNRELSVIDADNHIDFLFLRPRDIAVYVADGVLDLGITGRDLLLDSTAPAQELMALGFGGSRFCYAAPAASQLSSQEFAGLRIATSYPNIVIADQLQRNCQAEIIKLDGAVEISIELGVADLIADVVDSGATLKQMGLKIIGEPILFSEAILIGNHRTDPESPAIHRFMRRIEGIIVARSYVIVEYDVKDQLLAHCCQITPGIEAPTVSPLNKAGWCAVKAMVRRSELNTVIDQLEEAGANGIIVSDIRTCRI
ncbi:MAG: ATP phosphoribosyltransferase [Lentisphaeria bacterium]|jgi:ATP phosphoribosyltransferase|nr:ATP phosphoribosyltransferase [Lentisphaeria bacterium]MDY0176782.1 ATP phosphoribosyltransferase [Lentisphaeria bacterium]NLZ60596.1 ATP phosphoribosyltransferase [Lentisphaerota bacterium]